MRQEGDVWLSPAGESTAETRGGRAIIGSLTSKAKGGERMLLGAYTRTQVWWNDLRERAAEERGATGVEYGLLVALIAAVIVAVVLALGQKVKGGFDTVNSKL